VKADELIRRAQTAGRNLLEHEALWLLEEYGFPLPAFEILPHGTPLSACSLAGLPYPLVAKAISAQIIHKTEADAVRLDIRHEKQLAEALGSMERSIMERMPQAVIEGWLVRPYIPEGIEIIAGCLVDAQFGPVVMVGIGGIFTEAYRDVSFRLVPLSALDAEQMIDELKGQALLNGLRSRQRVPRGELAALLVRLGRLADENPNIVECDLNPIICHAGALSVADVRVLVRGR